MPRVGDVFQLLSGTLAVPNTTIASAPYNAQQNDWVTEANNPRPVSAGGTGATTATAARTSLGAIGAGDLASAPTKATVVDTDSVVIIDSVAPDVGKNKRWLVAALKASLATMTDTVIHLISTDGTGAAGPRLDFDRQSPSPSNTPTPDTLGYIRFLGRNTPGDSVLYADVFANLLDPTNGSEDGGLVFRRSVNGAISPALTINSAGVLVNQALTVGTTLTANDTSTFTGVATFNAQPLVNGNILMNIDNGVRTQYGPVLYLDRMQTTPVGNDLGGALVFRGRTSALATTTYADIYLQINDVTTSTTDSSLLFRTHTAGSLSPALTLGSTLATVHSPMTVQGAMSAAGNLSVTGTSTFTGAATFNGAQIFTGASSFTSGSLAITETNTTGTGSALYLKHARNPPVAGDQLGTIYFQGNNSALANTTYGWISMSATDPTSSSEDATLSFVTMTAGSTATAAMTLSPSLATITSPLTVSGSITASGSITGQRDFIASTALLYLGTTGAGTIALRPNGVGSGTGQFAIASNGDVTVAGNITATASTISTGTVTATGQVNSGQIFNSTSANVVLQGVGGNVYLRPTAGSSTNEVQLLASGLMNITTGPLTVAAAAAVNTLGATISGGSITLSSTGTSTHQKMTFLNQTATAVGNIQTTGTATAFNTSSDERLKDFIGPYDPVKAIDIIRRDPVRDFTWKESGDYAVGWGAQTSHAISPDLASPPEDETHPWGIDQGKRTPYLWAALSWALDRIDDLHQRIKALEEGTPA